MANLQKLSLQHSSQMYTSLLLLGKGDIDSPPGVWSFLKTPERIDQLMIDKAC